MMISDEQFIRQYLAPYTQNQTLLHHFILLQQLLKSHGKRCLEHPAYLQALKTHCVEAYDLALLLKKLNKLTPKHLQYIITLLRKYTTTQSSSFVVTSDISHHQNIAHALHDTFDNVTLDFQSSPDIGIAIAWSWYHYKRNLDKDLQLLLWS